ncbi:hypothetical protein SAMN02745824_2703 [Parasphingorhabdus marina DSM 22363]|uniref:Lipopolysaccharide assembly protein A domain-containing protein n=1 Tax=Parasphingorhabdus marina DSM 22363 TaxID=1123272 RepID=A0A1N6G701_9SPHN|nr:LapA family protein [Parasphingorhabdus marina]SIO03264.1 hypothetical protein SAMN02745824_2703 [Parasphingorhabdus marina DSM 22363]
MQFIKTLFWVILAVILVVFAANNWSPTSVLVWQDIRVDTKLPVLVIGAFLLGFLPMWILHRTMKWRMSRRIKTLEAAARPAPSPAPVATQTPDGTPAPKAPVAKPLDLQKDQIAKAEPAVSPVEKPPADKTPTEKPKAG